MDWFRCKAMNTDECLHIASEIMASIGVSQAERRKIPVAGFCMHHNFPACTIKYRGNILLIAMHANNLYDHNI